MVKSNLPVLLLLLVEYQWSMPVSPAVLVVVAMVVTEDLPDDEVAAEETGTCNTSSLVLPGKHGDTALHLLHYNMPFLIFCQSSCCSV